ncbi:SDR family oxidoreductase [Paramaledivibacter caminithermalis]|jgi:3-oxoacyl-[acyl-carrier protein] reductase|uniref:3-oxoacyl-[acyl-carrier protein] reductase n=1 Tax=Paramaledivibacter caminithermalis (strain DSM 15212 / CIP 107654 / DViRD3) TaxID=1121301 RepID=A0A1M6L6X7_PARC5|nr:SDR family NAD(P)-dependent oxidoreductase [Paramaledivibacter caminithermalis]SHJ66884.1 3-oxoacyl-[acyl-carrier protein] reductase [Paramaledivibacter caminithermalis DSM 15212]
MLKQKVAIVTGGSKGLGRAIVENFANNGCKIVFTYLNSEDDANKLCERYKGNVFAIKADASDYDKAFEVVEKTIEKFGKVDILVNNVGLAKDKPIWKLEKKGWDFTLNHTLNPCFYYTRAVVNEMIKNRYGKIINIGSINGLRGREGSVGYSSAKAAIVGFTKTIAKELGDYNITANVVAPGYIDTDGQANTSQIVKKVVLNECSIRRLTKPYEVAELVAFLASDKANNITGEIIKIDCGQYI